MQTFGTPQNDMAYSVAVDLLVAGITDGVLAGPATSSAANSYVRKYDPSGLELWTRQLNATAAAGPYGVAVDGSGIVYFAGETVGPLPGQQSVGDRDGFLIRFASDGTQLSTQQFGTDAYDQIAGVAIGFSGTRSLIHLAAR